MAIGGTLVPPEEQDAIIDTVNDSIQRGESVLEKVVAFCADCGEPLLVPYDSAEN